MTGSETILLVMTNPARRAACFAALVGPPHRIVRGFADADDAIAALDSCDCGCVVIESDGLGIGRLTRLLGALAQYPALVAMLLADTLAADEALALIRAAPCDLLPQGTEIPDLGARVNTLLPLARQRGLQAKAEANARAQLARLSTREAEVLGALAAGQTSKDIARSFGVSPRTIEVHRASIMRRTGAATLAELLRLCFLADFAGTAIMSKAA